MDSFKHGVLLSTGPCAAAEPMPRKPARKDRMSVFWGRLERENRLSGNISDGMTLLNRKNQE